MKKIAWPFLHAYNRLYLDTNAYTDCMIRPWSFLVKEELSQTGKPVKYCILEECGKPLKGRLDQKFCNDSCRTAYHNSRRSREQAAISAVDGILRGNRRILEALVGMEPSVHVSRRHLIFKGFNFDFYTNTSRDQEGLVCYFCYDFGYAEVRPDDFLVVRNRAAL